MSNDMFPFMNDEQVEQYGEAYQTPPSELTEDQKRLIQMGENQPDLMYLELLSERLKAGDKLPLEVSVLLEAIFDRVDRLEEKKAA